MDTETEYYGTRPADLNRAETVRLKLFLFLFASAWALALSSVALGQEASKLPNYVPVLPAVTARNVPIDPKKGYAVVQSKPGFFIITDGGYQSAFVTTGKGVILFDAPISLAPNLIQAVSEVTKEPIKLLVYSHSHLDHISGASVLREKLPGLQILAEEDNAAFLREKNDPRRPVPTQTFKDHKTLKLGSVTAELKRGRWHSNEGDLFIYLPEKKALIAIDTFPAGWVPFQDFDLSTNMYAYLKVFDQLLAYDFDVLVAGHLGVIANRDDVKVSKEYAMDVYHTVKRIHDGTDQMKLITEAAAKYGMDNKFALFRTVLDSILERCTKEVQARWITRLAGADAYTASHCRAALTYARWDD